MLPVVNPFTGEVIKELPTYTENDVRSAIDRAHRAFPAMTKMTAYQRSSILNKVSQLIQTHADELAHLMVSESGKPFKYALGEVHRAVETFAFAADEARHLHGETIPLDAAKGGAGKFGYYVRVPIGVIAAITPFNFPLNLVAHKVAPAIAAGCTIVLKPSPLTPLTSLRLRELCLEAGLPAGAFEVVIGDIEVGQWLTTDPHIAMISFTGSPPVAREISKIAGLRRTVFELGGNAATIIDESADLDRAIMPCVIGSFAYSGQVCISVQRLYVHRAVYDTFKQRFLERTSHLKTGDPNDPNTDVGPMISDKEAARVEQWIQDAVQEGATLLIGGHRTGRFVAPTVLEHVTDSMAVMRKEVFGPVANLIPFDTFEESLHAVNNSVYGLQAGVYTSELVKMLKAVEILNVGGVIINDVPTFRVDQMPYGGNKESGVGREGPRFAIEDMTVLKTVVINP